MANPHRATITAALGAPPVEHDLCLNVGALAEFEAEFGCNALDYLPSYEVVGGPLIPARRRLTVREAVSVIHLALKGAGKNVGRPAVQAMLDAMGPLAFISIAHHAVAAAFASAEPNPPREGESPSA